MSQKQAQPQTDDNSPVRVSISVAARLFGVNSRTIRRAIREQKLRYVVVQNRYKILFSSLVTWSQATTAARQKRDQMGIGQWVEQWRIRNTLYSPRSPQIKKSPTADDSLTKNNSVALDS